jgi:hypothetical protein
MNKKHRTKKIIMTRIISGGILIMILFTACHKTVDPVDGSNAVITLSNPGAHYVTGNITVNPKDSLFFSFSITSPLAMKYVSIQKNPVNQTAFVVRDTLTPANKNSYTTVKKLVADSANGDYVYRIVAHDSSGRYIGHKDIVVSVKADFNFFTYRFLRVPDTTAKTNTCYMAATTGTLYSYSTGAASSAAIDFGVMYDTTGAATASTTDDLKFCLYALSAPQSQIPFYDISTWTKNATIMKKAASPAFNTLLSAGGLRSAAVTNLSSGTTNKVTQLATGNLVFFKTVSGKAGCLQVVFVNDAGTAKESYINVDVKIEK